MAQALAPALRKAGGGSIVNIASILGLRQVLLLATDASRYMTGSVIAVDGGQLVSSL